MNDNQLAGDRCPKCGGNRYLCSWELEHGDGGLACISGEADILRGQLADCTLKHQLLSISLHRNRCHPDFSYMVTPNNVDLRMMKAGGWERNKESEADVIDYHWRRSK